MVSQIVYIVWYVSFAYSPIHHFPRQRKQQQYSRIRRSNKLLSLAIVNLHSYTRAHTKSSRHFENFCFILSLDAILFFCFRSIYKSCRVIPFANFVSFVVTMRCSSVFCVYVLGSGNALGFTRFVVAYKSLVRNATRWLETRLLSSAVRLYYLFQRVYFGRWSAGAGFHFAFASDTAKTHGHEWQKTKAGRSRTQTQPNDIPLKTLKKKFRFRSINCLLITCLFDIRREFRRCVV